MFVKELCVDDPLLQKPIVYGDVEAKDSNDFKGFIEIKFLKDENGFDADEVVLFNRSSVREIIL